ncbi:MAG TPA: histidine phosphatase family protein [Pseudolabrys sp.]|nr:histidine phosphatase family protein [Pseudolabrys sp.]
MQRSRSIEYLIACLGAALLALVLLPVQGARAADDATWALLKKPGHFVLLRHSNAPGATPEPYGIDLKNCAIQRSLDDAGRAQARRVGDAFRKHGIAHARLVSSQFCRALETARLTGLGPVAELPALNQVFLTDASGMHETAEKTAKFLKTIPAKQLTVLVSHVTNIQAIAGANLSSGEMAVVHIDAAGAVAVDGRILVP